MISFFKENPELYEKTFGYRNFKEQVNFLDKVFKKYRVKSVLDIACGHIPHGRILAKRGYKVSGLDVVHSLLKLGRKRAVEEKININLYKKDMTNFYIKKFDAAYIMFNSILHLTSYNQLYSHFESVNRNLKRKGIYIIDLSQSSFKNPFKRHKINRKILGIRSVITYTPKNPRNLLAEFKVDTYYNKKKYTDKFPVLMFLPINLLQSLAHETGFKIVALFSDFTFKKDLKNNNFTYIAILQKVMTNSPNSSKQER